MARRLWLAGSDRTDPHKKCAKDKAQPREVLETAVKQIEMISNVKRRRAPVWPLPGSWRGAASLPACCPLFYRCGSFGNIAVPYWISHIKSVTPEGVLIDQTGECLRCWAPGANRPGVHCVRGHRGDPAVPWFLCLHRTHKELMQLVMPLGLICAPRPAQGL